MCGSPIPRISIYTRREATAQPVEHRPPQVRDRECFYSVVFTEKLGLVFGVFKSNYL